MDADAVSLLVRKALSGVARVHGRFGLQTAVKLVHGESDPRLERAGLTRVPTFGNLREHSADWLLALLRRCVTAGWVSFTGGDRPVVVLTEDAAVMKRNAPRACRPPGARPPCGRAAPSAPVSASPRRAAPARHRDDLAAASRSSRRCAATGSTWRAPGHRAFIVASDRTLRDIAALRPALDELLLAYGIGRQKAERYGRGFLRVVAGASGAAASDAGD
jgi:ATP-dependent DNA helicase RecQ